MKFTNLVLAIIATFSILSCDKIDQNRGGDQAENAIIRLEVDLSGGLTRATQQQESAIKSLTAYMFVVDGKPSAGKLVPSTTKTVINGTTASVSIIIENDFNQIDDARVDVYLVANANIKLPNDNTAKAAFMSSTIRDFDNNASGDNFPGLAAVKYVGVFNVRPVDNPSVTTVTLARVQARVFVSNTQVAGEAPNCLEGYTISFSNLADRAVLTHPHQANFGGVLFNAQYEYTVKGNNGDEDFYNQEPVGYLYPVPADRVVTVTVKNPSKTATKTATFSPQSGKNYRIKVTPGNTADELAIAIELWQGEEKRDDRYMVLLVAGQSNSVGYDESFTDLNGISKINPNAFQLAYQDKYGGNLNVVPLRHCADNLQDMSGFATGANREQVGMGTKGIHLPLANELLKPGRLPKGYKLLVIPVAFGGTSLTSGNAGSYNAIDMKPVNAAGIKWGIGSPYNKTMVDRVKYALSLGSENKFLGVVWCQGENDATKSKPHYEVFEAMTQDFFDQINAAGYADRCPRGSAGKHLWYNYSSTYYWHNWAAPGVNSSATFGGYKVWNPDTFIHVPKNTDTNAVNGNGATSSTRPSHFGNNAFTNVVAPLVAQCMDENGGLFNGKPIASGNRFVEKEIRTDADHLGGSFSDSDIQSGLQFFYPFINTLTENKAPNNGYTITGLGSVALTSNAKDLIDINGNARQRRVFNVDPTGGYLRIQGSQANVTGDWSIAFLVRRTANLNLDNQPIIHGSGGPASPFFGYKTLTTNNVNDEIIGRNVEFVVRRNENITQLQSDCMQFIDSDNVRSMDQWIHCVVTFVAPSKTRIYANGQLVSQGTVSGLLAADFSDLYIGSTATYPVAPNAMLADFGLWNKELSEATIKKLYLYSYYGYTK